MNRSAAVLARGLCAGVLAAGVTAVAGHGDAWGHPETVEVGRLNVEDLPGGKEADGIIGDYVLRNDVIEALVSGDQAGRKANRGAYYAGITPGCLYDMTFRDEANDQMTIYSPSGQIGDVTVVRPVDAGDGMAAVEVVVSGANDGLYRRHLYTLGAGWQGLLIRTEFRNETEAPMRARAKDLWRHLWRDHDVTDIHVGDASNPSDRAGYAFGWLTGEGLAVPGDSLDLAPGESVAVARFYAIGRSPADAFGIVAARRGATGVVRGRIVGPDGEGVGSARVLIDVSGDTLLAYPGEDGTFSFRLPPGEYGVEVEDLGRDTVTRLIRVSDKEETSLDVAMTRASAIEFDIVDASKRPIPCKVQFVGVEGTPSPDLGPPHRALGCEEQVHSESGRFSVQVPPGTYRVVVTRGIEFEHLERVVRLGKGERQRVRGTLLRVVDTRGWVSTDFHNHSTPSGDTPTSTVDRIRNLAAEQVEFAPSTEHNRIHDWQPAIDSLGLHDEVATVTGLELTGSGPHLNAFPLQPASHAQDDGAPTWNRDPRIDAITLRNFQGPDPDRWVHLNHPDMSEDFVDRDQDGREDGGYRGLEVLIDGIEAWGSGILKKTPFWFGTTSQGEPTVGYLTEFIWLQMLNRGHRATCIAVSDAHSVVDGGVGGWRTYVPSSTDNPGAIDWKEIVRNAKAGQAIITNGPFLTVRATGGALPGASVRAEGFIDLDVRVQCTDWIDIDRVQILVNSRQDPALDFRRETHPSMFRDGVEKFNQTVRVPLARDSHVIVVAWGEGSNLATGYGTSWESEMHPCAYTNPIWVDVDGGGFAPNYDTLDWPLPVAKVLPEDARRAVKAYEERAGGVPE